MQREIYVHTHIHIFSKYVQKNCLEENKNRIFYSSEFSLVASSIHQPRQGGLIKRIAKVSSNLIYQTRPGIYELQLNRNIMYYLS